MVATGRVGHSRPAGVSNSTACTLSLRLLLDKGANVDAADSNGATALILSAYQGHEPCVRLLLEAGADKNKKVSGMTASELAECCGHTNICELLR